MKKQTLDELRAEAKKINFEKLAKSFSGATLPNSGELFNLEEALEGMDEHMKEYKERLNEAFPD